VTTRAEKDGTIMMMTDGSNLVKLLNSHIYLDGS
jgi:hypothetical protein